MWWLSDLKKHLQSIDWVLVCAVAGAIIFGFVAIKSATNNYAAQYGSRAQLLKLLVHAAAVVIGVVCAFILSKSDYGHIVKYQKYIYIFNILALILTFFIGIGDDVGNRNWIKVGPISVQPSEIIKILFILTFAKHLDDVRDEINKPKNVLFIVLHFAIIAGLILILESDLGSVLIFICIFIAMCFAAGINLWYFLGAIFATAAASPLIWMLLGDYQQKRILVGFNPDLDPLDKGYQAIHSRTAISAGGFKGAGWQQGYYTQTGYVPKQQTDFIYSAVGEEFGFWGAMLVLILIGVVVIRIFFTAKNARNNLGSLICVGVMSIFIAQTIENVGMCLGLMPVIGITLPFFSQGGSSVVSSLLGIGLVLSVNSRRNLYYFTRNERADLDGF